MKVYNLYSKNLNSVGDDVSGSLLYFDLGVEQILYDVAKWGDLLPNIKNNLVILGGGGHFHIPHITYNNGNFKHIEEILKQIKNVILWGVGHNVYGETKIKYPEYMNKFLLVGIRDLGTPYRWVPCASCMSSLFDKQYEVKNKIVIYRHKWDFNSPLRGIPPLELPTKFCEGISFSEVIEFLASAETIYTNSYHGAYWGLLLNKNIIVFDKFSSKFYGLPNLSNKEDPVSTGFLNICREANIRFYKDVKSIIEKMK